MVCQKASGAGKCCSNLYNFTELYKIVCHYPLLMSSFSALCVWPEVRGPSVLDHIELMDEQIRRGQFASESKYAFDSSQKCVCTSICCAIPLQV